LPFHDRLGILLGLLNIYLGLAVHFGEDQQGLQVAAIVWAVLWGVFVAAPLPHDDDGLRAEVFGHREMGGGDGNKRAAETEMVTTHNPMSSHHTLSSAEWSEKRRSSSVVSTSGKWQTLKDGNGDTYYYCPSTNVTQWERPRGLLTASESSVTNY